MGHTPQLGWAEAEGADEALLQPVTRFQARPPPRSEADACWSSSKYQIANSFPSLPNWLLEFSQPFKLCGSDSFFKK
jgi:hypothetical protein